MLNDRDRKEINDWLKSKRDYNQGLLILRKHTKNRILLKKNNIPIDKIVFELNKFVGNGLFAPQKIQTNTPKKIKIKTVRDNLIPIVKHRIQELIKSIDMMHKQLYDLGTSNDELIVNKRKEILDKRIPLIEMYDRLYQIKEAFFTTGIWDTEVDKLIKTKIENEPSITKAKEVPDVVISKMTDLELFKRKNQLSSSITKTRNFIKYKSIKKLEVENPLTGEEKKKAETKLKGLREEQKKILSEIKRRKDG